jgi:multidrug efflux pump subunit AcrB
LKSPKRGAWRRERRVLEAALIRLRPIITTTLAALLGARRTAQGCGKADR